MFALHNRWLCMLRLIARKIIIALFCPKEYQLLGWGHFRQSSCQHSICTYMDSIFKEIDASGIVSPSEISSVQEKKLALTLSASPLLKAYSYSKLQHHGSNFFELQADQLSTDQGPPAAYNFSSHKPKPRLWGRLLLFCL